MVQYLTANVDEMRQQDYTSIQIAKAVKGRDPGGREAALNFRGNRYVFGPGNPNGAVDLWAIWCATEIQKLLVDDSSQFVLVPVPNSSATTENADSFRTLELANMVADLSGANVSAHDELRWTEEMTPASQGGTRDPYILFPKLDFSVKGSPQAQRILIDDILTSGGRPKVCKAKLVQENIPVHSAYVCGRTVRTQLENPYKPGGETLEDYDPEDPFGFGVVEL